MQTITVYPMAFGTFVGFTAYHAKYELEGAQYDEPWIDMVPGTELGAIFQNWEPEVEALVKVRARLMLSSCQFVMRGSQGLQHVEQVNKWAIHVTPPLPSFVSGNVVLLGDAVRL